MVNIILVILWAMYATWEGLREGRYWYYKYHCSPFKVAKVSDDHTQFTLQRTIVLIAFTIATGSLWFVLLAACMFPFFHDGSYYHHRNKLNSVVYPKKWFDQSTTSTAVLTKFFTPKVRVVGLVISILITIILL